MTENELSRVIVTSAIEVHSTLGGPGLLESVYEEAIVWELQLQGLQVTRQQIVPITYKGQALSTPLRLDLCVNGIVIVECKSTVQLNPVFRAQLLTYLRLTGIKLGILINFGEVMVANGIQRVVNRL